MLQEIQNNLLAEYLTKSELAYQLHRSVRSIDRWALTGDGPPSVRIGRKTLYRKGAVLEWLRNLEKGPDRSGRRASRVSK
jgi:hypothetical protein